MDVLKLYEGGFPLSVETLEFIQDAYTGPISALANIAGDNKIIKGIVTTGGTNIDGYFVRNGEVVPFLSSPTGSTVTLIEKTVQVPYNSDADSDGNLDLKDAYKYRYAKTGTVTLTTGEAVVETFDFSLLKKYQQPLPIGAAMLWFDPANIPAGWRVCDGTGGTVNGAPAVDLRNKFIKGAGSENAYGTTGGSKSTTLAATNIPKHQHTTPAHVHGYKDSYYVEKNASTNGIDGAIYVGAVFGSGSSDSDNTHVLYRNATTDVGGNGTSGDGGSALAATPFTNEPNFFAAIWIQYIGS